MLAYRHLFHAGNFADVFKHALLAQLLRTLTAKDKPLLYLDTHAGTGRYDLTHEWARKNAEYASGIALVWQRPDAPPELAPYLDAVRAENADGRLHWYPGSPLIARRLLRARDRMVLTELNQKDCAALAGLFARQRGTLVRNEDGYQALKAYLPPPERRALVLIDSSFDRAQEFKRLSQAFAGAHRKFATGVFALWYPLMEPVAMSAFERSVVATGIRRILKLELAVRDLGISGSLRGCGMLVANPPFGFERAARTMLAWLWPLLAREGEGGHKIRWLAAE